jgi:hypothetical protein
MMKCSLEDWIFLVRYCAVQKVYWNYRTFLNPLQKEGLNHCLERNDIGIVLSWQVRRVYPEPVEGPAPPSTGNEIAVLERRKK